MGFIADGQHCNRFLYALYNGWKKLIMFKLISQIYLFHFNHIHSVAMSIVLLLGQDSFPKTAEEKPEELGHPSPGWCVAATVWLDKESAIQYV